MHNWSLFLVTWWILALVLTMVTSLDLLRAEQCSYIDAHAPPHAVCPCCSSPGLGAAARLRAAAGRRPCSGQQSRQCAGRIYYHRHDDPGIILIRFVAHISARRNILTDANILPDSNPQLRPGGKRDVVGLARRPRVCQCGPGGVLIVTRETFCLLVLTGGPASNG